MAATVAAIAAGGCELGLGAGWIADDFEIAGMPFERAGVRLSRLEESVEAIKLLWTEETTTYAGEHVRLRNAPSVLPLPLPRRPKLLLGGTLRRAIGMAGRHADIVSIFPSVASGRIGWPGWAEGSTVERTAEQTAWRAPALVTQAAAPTPSSSARKSASRPSAAIRRRCSSRSRR